MDKRPFIGIALIFIVLVIWMTFLTPKGGKKEVHIEKPKQAEVKDSLPHFVQDTIRREEILDTVDTKVARIIVSRVGASIKSIRLKHYKEPEGGWVELIPENEKALCGIMGETDLSEEMFELVERGLLSLVYEFVEGKAGTPLPTKLDSTLRGSRVFKGEGVSLLPLRVRKVYSFTDSSYAFDLTVDFPDIEKYEIQWNSGLRATEKNKENEVRYFGGIVRLGGTVIVKDLNSLDTLPKGEPGIIEWAGAKNKYFLASIVPLVETENYTMSRATLARVGGGCMSGCMPAGEVNQEDIKVRVSLVTQRSKAHKFKVYIGPLDYDILRGVGFGLEDACYFGFKWIRPISRLFLKVLLGLYKVIPNYGVVIIIFSLILSIVFFPLTKMSQKSVIGMQKLQPKLQELKQKYAKEPKKLNQATMELYRKQGVSPLSGCLPLLIQMPIFFALYAILDTTIALRGAVFIPHWIDDLSQHDPYYALPLMMGGMMFLQQKLQSRGSVSTQMQQQQKMMMYLMPIMFTFIFLRFPAGLVLYWFVYNIFSFTETYILMRPRPVVEVPTQKKYKK